MIPTEWKNIEFSYLFDIKSGMGFKYSEYAKEGIPLIKIDNVSHGYINWKNKSYLPQEYIQIYPELVLQEGDMLLALNRPITQGNLKFSRVKKEDIPSILYQRVGKIIFKNNDVNQDFYYYLLERVIFNFVKKKSVGSDQPFISTTELKKIKIPAPSLTEQKKIANILKKWDEAINLTERLIEKKERYKKALINKLITHAKKTDDYSVVDLFKLGRGRVISKGEMESNKGIYPVYSSQTQNNGEMGKINTFDFSGEYITWTTDGANAGTVFYRNGKFNCTNVCGIAKLQEDKKVDLKYVALFLQTVTKKYVSYVGNPKLMNNVFSCIVISLPNYEKQKLVGKLFESIDFEIQFLESVSYKTRAEKNGLMQKLLTGKIRV